MESHDKEFIFNLLAISCSNLSETFHFNNIHHQCTSFIVNYCNHLVLFFTELSLSQWRCLSPSFKYLAMLVHIFNPVDHLLVFYSLCTPLLLSDLLLDILSIREFWSYKGSMFNYLFNHKLHKATQQGSETPWQGECPHTSVWLTLPGLAFLAWSQEGPLQHMLFVQMEAAHTWVAGRTPFSLQHHHGCASLNSAPHCGDWHVAKSKGRLYICFLHVSTMLQQGLLWYGKIIG